MTTSAAPERIVLKLLSGIQTGAEVFLDPGEYTIGSGAEDDIQIADVSLSPGHGRLRLGPTKVEIQGRNGRFVTTNDRVIEADAESWTELEPLEVVVAGTTQFAIGPRSANWTSLAEVPQGLRFQQTKEPAEAPTRRPTAPRRGPHVGTIAASVVALVVAGGIAFLALGSQPIAALRTQPATVDQFRAALAAFPFGPAITVREEADGGVYASGFVETPVERRAIALAAEKLAIPVKMRVYTLQSMRSEIATLIQSSRLPLEFTLAPTGTVALTGHVLDDRAVAQLSERISGDVGGVTAVENNVRTAKVLLGEIEKLAKRASIGTYVVLRLEGNHVEITGLLPADKVDTWVGFLQAYSKQFAAEIGLRSFVQLQPAPGAGPTAAPGPDTPAISLGPTIGPESGDVTLDIDRLKRGLYDAADLLVGTRKKPQPVAEVPTPAPKPATANAAAPGPAPAVVAEPDKAQSTAASAILREIETSGARPAEPVPADGAKPAAAATTAWAEAIRPNDGDRPSAPPPAPAVSAPAAQTETPDSASGKIAAAPDGDAAKPTPAPVAEATPRAKASATTSDIALTLASAADRLIARWMRAPGPTAAGDDTVAKALDAVAFARAGVDATAAPTDSKESRIAYLPLLASEIRSEAAPERACWPGSRITIKSVPVAAFWLDMLSLSESLSLKQFSLDQQRFLLEAATNPRQTAACLASVETAGAKQAGSFYLTEATRNPDILRFVVRDLPAGDLDIVGVSLAGDRYVQLRDGFKRREGMMANPHARLALIGELGVVLREQAGFSVGVFGSDINWKLSQN